jgi:uncharacterized metal-binding protein
MSEGPPTLQRLPGYCPMRLMPDVFNQAAAEYDKPPVREFARLASVQEFQCFERLPDGIRAKLPRIEELIQFARKCSYKKLGIAHCGGLSKEAAMLTDDTLFIKYCDVPLTVLAVKDRLLAHNPLAALYLSESYYRRLRNGIR